MPVRFAGSLELAQRRRRRLAQEADGLPIASGTPRASRIAQQAGSASDPVRSFCYSGPRLPRDTIIPGSMTVILSLGLIGLAAWAGILWLSLSNVADQMGIRPLVELDGGAIPRYFSTVALLLTAQLSLLIYWHRSRSRKDFLGRYRVWGWAGLFWCVICLAQATQGHLPVLSYLESRYAIQCWRGEHLFWFIPLATCLLALYRLVGRDINPSRASSAAWNTTFGIGLLVAGLHFGLDLLLPVSRRTEVQAATTLLWQFALAFFCLIHARYVTHINNEAGGKRASMRSRISRRMVPVFSQLGERILSVRFQRRAGSEAAAKATKDQGAASGRKGQQKLKTASESRGETPRTFGKQKSGEQSPARPSVTVNSTASGTAAVARSKEPQAKQVDPPSPAKEKGPGWTARFRQKLTARWTRTSVDKPAEEKKTKDRTIAETPAPKKPVSQPGALGKRLAAKRETQPDVEKVKSATVPAAPQEKGPSWTERLRASLASRWVRRIDPPQPEAKGSGPHAAMPGAKGQEARQTTETAASTVQRPMTSRPQPAAAPAPQARAAPSSQSQSARSVRPTSQREMEEDSEDYDDEDRGRLSHKERKRQKKRQRQRD